MFDREEISRRGRTIWRYREAYGLPPEAYGLPGERLDGEAYGSTGARRTHYEGATPVTLGEGTTPLVERTVDGTPVLFKLEFMNPSGSFKDRGASVLVTYLRYAGVRSLVEDSYQSGEAAVDAREVRDVDLVVVLAEPRLYPRHQHLVRDDLERQQQTRRGILRCHLLARDAAVAQGAVCPVVQNVGAQE